MKTLSKSGELCKIHTLPVFQSYARCFTDPVTRLKDLVGVHQRSHISEKTFWSKTCVKESIFEMFPIELFEVNISAELRIKYNQQGTKEMTCTHLKTSWSRIVYRKSSETKCSEGLQGLRAVLPNCGEHWVQNANCHNASRCEKAELIWSTHVQSVSFDWTKYQNMWCFMRFG